MTCLGEIRSPLEASVQELCNARLVEVMCTWTRASLPFPPANFVCGLLPRRASARVDPPPAELAKSDDPVTVERQRRSEHAGCFRSADGASVAVYYRNEKEVREGFRVALRAMGVADVEQLPEPAKPPARGVKAVKARRFPYLLPFCLLLFACGPTASPGRTDAITFDHGKTA